MRHGATSVPSGLQAGPAERLEAQAQQAVVVALAEAVHEPLAQAEAQKRVVGLIHALVQTLGPDLAVASHTHLDSILVVVRWDSFAGLVEGILQENRAEGTWGYYHVAGFGLVYGEEWRTGFVVTSPPGR